MSTAGEGIVKQDIKAHLGHPCSMIPYRGKQSSQFGQCNGDDPMGLYKKRRSPGFSDPTPLTVTSLL